MSVQKVSATKKTTPCVFKLIQVLDTTNKKSVPLFNNGAMNLQTTCMYVQIGESSVHQGNIMSTSGDILS